MKAELLAYANNVSGVWDYELAQAAGILSPDLIVLRVFRPDWPNSLGRPRIKATFLHGGYLESPLA